MLRHIILTQGRSGSNFLASTLNLHPALVNFGEVFGRWTLAYKLRRFLWFQGLSDKEFFELIYRDQKIFYFAQAWSAFSHIRQKESINFKYYKNVKSIGIKDFCFHFQRSSQLEDFLTQNSDIAVIYLKRQNLLHRSLSLQSMSQRKIVSTKKREKLGKMHVEPKKLLTDLNVLQEEANYEHDLLQKLSKNPILKLSYEESFFSSKSINRMVNETFNFLGVNPIEHVSSHQKFYPSL